MKRSSSSQWATALQRRKKAQPSFSLRSVSRSLKVSPSFLSEVIAGKKSLPLKHVNKLTQLLDMDALATRHVKEALLRETTDPILLEALTPVAPEAASSVTSIEMSKPDYALLSRWYFLAILDLTTCRGFRAEPLWIAKRLGITAIEARQAWEVLVQLQCLELKNGRWEKKLSHIRFPTRSSEMVVRNYHGQNLLLARQELAKTKQEDFDRRLVTGMSVAANPEKIAAAKLKIQGILQELGKDLAQGECTEVYHLQVQLFPVTKEENA